MAKHGSIGEFRQEVEEWSAYAERLEYYFAANDVAAGDKKRAILLSVCGPSTYVLIRSLVAPQKPTEFSFEDLVEKVNKYHNPRPSAVVQRFKFNSRTRQSGETVAAYVAELKKLSEFCEFGGALDEMLRDRLVWGIADSRVQHRLLAESSLTFAKALEIAQAMELATRDLKDLQPDTASSTSVHKLQGHRANFAPTPSKPHPPCYRCGGKHTAANCRFKTERCRGCNKVGHIVRMCRSKPKQDNPPGKSRGLPTHKVEEASPPEEYTLYPVVDQDAPSTPLKTAVTLDGKVLDMEVDTGASLSLISEATFKSLWNASAAPALQESAVKLRTYTGEEIAVLGSILVTAGTNDQEARLPLLVVAGSGPSLLGRDWLTKLRLDWKEILSITVQHTLESILRQHEKVFEPGLGMLKGVEAKLFVDAQAQPAFYKARSVPFALRQKVEAELDRLEKQGVITPVQFSDWAAPIVPVVKRDGTVRICGDYKLTVNKAAKLEVYPLPRIEDLLTSLAGGKSFTKLDLSHAYLQVRLEETSQQYVTVNTHRGLFRYQRLPFGVASAPAIFQRLMETLLQGLPGVCTYLDDILVTGTSDEEHFCNLSAVLQRLETSGMKLKKEKCAFLLPRVEYLGHGISSDGLEPSASKVAAIVNAPAPQNLTELRSLLGLVNYYRKFLPDVATILTPLHQLLQQGMPWKWGREQQAALDQVKELIDSPNLLVHFDGNKPLLLACDASPYGVGAVLSHLMDDGSERPIAFASRTLASAEKQYSQLDKEALAIIFGVKHFHQYIYGRSFTIVSDHRPLMHLLSPSKATPAMASARLQRWALLLGAYDYKIAYKAGEKHCNADALSRLPLPTTPSQVPTPPETIQLMEHLSMGPVSVAQIQQMTDRHPVLAQVKRFVQYGWPNQMDQELEELKPYWRRREELSLHDGCLLWGGRVVVPPQVREKVMLELHEAHPGVSRMKSLARQHVWWPGLDAEIEKMVKSCTACQSTRHNPQPAPLHPWEWPQRPWSRVHADYAGPFMGRMFLILVDAHTKWLDIHMTNSATSQVTIEKMRSTFAMLGLPEVLVTDNGTTFTSTEFEEFCKRNAICHVTSSPYHPASNGLAERSVQTFKEGMKKLTDGSLETRLARFLFMYRLTPQSVTGVSPAELLFGRPLRSPLDLLHPDIRSRVSSHQEQQKGNHDRHAKERVFHEEDLVYARNFRPGQVWLPGVVVQVRGPVSYSVKLGNGITVRRHVDHLRERTASAEVPGVDDSFPFAPVTDSTNDSATAPDPLPSTVAENSDTDPEPASSQRPARRSTRQRRPPNRWGFDTD